MPILGTVGAGSIKSFGGLANLGYFIKNSLRFRSSATSYLNRTPASASNQKTWTWSGWVKRGSLESFQRIFTAVNDANDESAGLRFDSSDRLDFIFMQDSSASITGRLVTTQVFRDPSAWYHIVFTQDTTNATSENRLRLWVNGVEVTAFTTDTAPTQNHDGYINSTNLHRIGSESHATSQSFDGYLAEVNLIDGQALTPSSFGKTDSSTGQWIPKKFSGAYGTNGFYLKFADTSAVTAAAIGKDFSGNSNNWTPNNLGVASTNKYPLSTLSTGSGSISYGDYLFDGSLSTTATAAQSSDNYITFTPTTGIPYTSSVRVYVYAANGYDITNYYSVNGGSETSFVGGGAGFNSFAWITVASGSGTLNSLKIRLTRGGGNQSSVGWRAIEVDGVILTNNYDGMVDSPTLSGTASNFATLNPLDIGSNAPTISNGNLTATTPTTGGGLVRATMAVSSGKWYWETTLATQATYIQIGISSIDYTASAYTYVESIPGALYFISGFKGTGPTGTNTSYGSSVANGDVVGVALDMDAGTLIFYKNGVSMGTAFTSISGTYVPTFGDSTNSIGTDFDVNFGQRPFAYTLPSGYKALNTYNLP